MAYSGVGLGPPPRKRPTLGPHGAGLDLSESALLGLTGRRRRSHSDPGVSAHRHMRASSALLTAPPKGSLTTGAVSAAAASCGTSGRVGAARATCSKRERTSQEGYDSISSCAARLSDAERSAALWQRLQQLESRNRELEQVVERMSATHISHRRAGQGSCAGEDSALPSAGSMEVDTTCSSAGMQRLQHPYVSKVLEQAHQARHRQAQAPHGQLGEQQEQPQQPLQQADGAAEHLSLPQQVVTLQREVKRLQQLNTMLQSGTADLEVLLREAEKQRREFAARFAFMTLDTDADGYINVDQVLSYELFSCYASCVLRAAFASWKFESGFDGFLCIDDFVRFVEFSEDRSSLEAQRFWFQVIDVDGDGHVGRLDMRVLYDAVDKSLAAGGVLQFEDLVHQVGDMVCSQRRPELGFTLQEMWRSKLGAGVVGLLTNANNMLLQRSTAEWNRGDFPL